MNQKNPNNVSLVMKRVFNLKNQENWQLGQWLRLTRWSKFSYLSLTALTLTLVLTFFSSGWLPIGESFGYSVQDVNQELILAQEERELEESPEAASEESPEAASEEPEESPEAASEEPEESPEAASEESPEAASEEPEESPEAASEEPEESPEAASEEREEGSGEELSFEEAKESLAEQIEERNEEWESAKNSSELSNIISAIATILMTIFITVLGTEVLQIPYRRAVILALGIITVFTQLNTGIFVLEKSLAGYEILSEQGEILKNKLEDVETEEELTEIREQFQELILESIAIE